MKQNSVLIQFTGIALKGVESMTSSKGFNFSYTLYRLIQMETNFKSEQREVTVSESILLFWRDFVIQRIAAVGIQKVVKQFNENIM